jgi:hypothetical protein
VKIDARNEIYTVYKDTFSRLFKATGGEAKAISKLLDDGCDKKRLFSLIAGVEVAQRLSRTRKEEVYGPPEPTMASLKKRTHDLAADFDRVFQSLPIWLSPYLLALNPSEAMRKAADESHRHFKAFRRDYNPKQFNLPFHQRMLLLRYVTKATKTRRPHLTEIAILLNEEEATLRKAWTRFQSKDFALIDLGSYLEDPAVLGHAALLSVLGTNPPKRK